MQNSQRQIFEQQISLLRCQIEQQQKREQKLKQLVNTLTQQMQYQKQTEEQNYKLTQLNEKLLQGLKQLKSRHSDELKYYDSQIAKLKQEIHEKINENQRLTVQHKKRQLAYQQEISGLKSIIDKKCVKINNLQNKIHNDFMVKGKLNKQKQSIFYIDRQSLDKGQRSERSSTELGASTLRVSQLENFCDSQNNMKASNISMMSKKSKMSDYMKMDKSQMKSMMKAIIKSKNQLQKYNMKNSDTTKVNKTMFN